MRLAGPLEADFRGAAGAFSLCASFSAPAGATTAVFGPSGSGKTTLLRAVAGLTRLAGRLRAGRTVWQDDAHGVFAPPHRRRIGFAFQEPKPFEHLTVAGNLRYAERRSGGTGPLGFGEVVERLELGPHLDRAPRHLSGGERQRLGLARALLSDPVVLLLDEPLSGLDRSARARILPWLRTLAAGSGMAILYVSHEPWEVVAVADRMVLLAGGRVREAGPAEAVFERLDHRESSARFEAGSLLGARVCGRSGPGITELDLGGERLRVPAIEPSRAAIGSTVRVRVRARDVALATRRPEATSVRNILEGAVLEIAEDHATPFAEVVVQVAGARLRSRITRDAVAELELKPGARVFALLKAVALDDP